MRRHAYQGNQQEQHVKEGDEHGGSCEAHRADALVDEGQSSRRFLLKALGKRYKLTTQGVKMRAQRTKQHPTIMGVFLGTLTRRVDSMYFGNERKFIGAGRKPWGG